MKSTAKEIVFVLFLIGLGIASRLVPHPWNFTAIGSMALFSGFSFKSNKFLIIIPFISLFISDSVLGFYDGMIYVYAGFAIGICLSLIYFYKATALSFKNRVMTLSGLSVVSSFLFFMLTNFGVWFGAAFYPQNVNGLLTAYVAGLPFLFNQIAGDLFFAGIIFYVYEYFNANVKTQKQIA